ncbi:hypothetical protein [Burkholderia gladioli]|uniref:hypothetical protein n=1 Tax=Burkholderia gladioli TaxID=28095 RepID=UPI00163E27AE|nr:hypothetical protein [Burkholderia gladioli]
MGIREEYERRRGEYIEYGRAVALLSKNEGVSFSITANWLIERRVHEILPCYVRSKMRHPQLVDAAKVDPERIPSLDEYVPHVPRQGSAAPTSDGPLDILSAIVHGDNLWWDWIGAIQRSVDENQRWKRDEFWKFVMDHGVAIDAATFEESSDCPTFLLGPLEFSQEAAIVSSSRFYRGSAAAWRYRAQAAETESNTKRIETIRRLGSDSLLGRLESMRFPLKLLESALSSNWDRYMAELILGSDEIEHRAKAAWEYKSIAHLAEEIFVQKTSAYWAQEPASGAAKGDLDRRSWQRWAQRELTGIANLRLYDAEEGLNLYVRDGERTFRVAETGDSVYDFVCRLRADGLSDDDGPGNNLPSWTRELFVHWANWESYRVVWAGYTNRKDPGYDELLRQKKALIVQETARRMGRPYQSDAAANSPAGLLDPDGALYPQELAIALAAWQAVTSNGQIAPDGIAAKAALLNWLGEAYPGLGKDAKDRIATVANWNKRGGATRTPD